MVSDKLSYSKTTERVCPACKRRAPRQEFFRLTATADGEVVLDAPASGKGARFGRSVYICRNTKCVELMLKGTRLKHGLEGRKVPGKEKRRQIAWPLESQLIHTLRHSCTEPLETCQNTQRKEG